MGIYHHYTVDELTALRDRLMASLHDRLTGPSAATTSGSGGQRSVQYNTELAQIRKELDAVNAELARRNGQSVRRPIYMV